MSHRLSDWPECVIELHCCAGSVGYPVRLLLKRSGDITFENLLKRLRCKRCRRFKPAPVYLVAGHHRMARHGPDADWSVELVPPPELKPKPPAPVAGAANDDAPAPPHSKWGGGFP
jgi:hypothetical protein